MFIWFSIKALYLFRFCESWKKLKHYRARENVEFFASDFYMVFEPTPSETQHNERATLAHFSNSHLRRVSHDN